MINSTTCAAIILSVSLTHAFAPRSTYDASSSHPVMIARAASRIHHCASSALSSTSGDLDSAESFDEGADLAKELYERVRVMELQKKLISEEEQKRRDMREAELRELNREPFSRRKEVSSAGPKRVTPVSSRSMNRDRSLFSSDSTGASINNNNGGLFNIGGSDLFSNAGVNGNNMSPQRQQQGGGRFDSNSLLDAASAERNILIQAAFVSVLLIVAIGIGMSGGITDGSERVFEDTVFAGDGVIDWMMEGADSSSPEVVSTDASMGGVFL